MPDPNIWQPATVAQREALDCPADLLFFGGSAGSLKSHWLLLDAMQEMENPRLRGLITRDSFPNLTDLIDKSFRIYKPKGGEYNEQKKTWTFPAGGQIRFGYMASDRDVFNHWGFEYSFQGHDESTFQTEYRIRTLTSRLRSTDPNLKLRIRLASNPGNIGADWHKKVFLRGACPVHEPEKCAVPGQLYTDRVWPSDNVKIPFSVAFIPGRLGDHNLLGEQYAESLRSLSGSLADQLLAGCWCKLEGAYFANWNKQKMVAPLASIGDQYWWTFFLSIDYGFGKSKAAAGLYVKTPATEGLPDGRIAKLGEISVPNMPAYEFGHLVAKTFIEPIVNRDYDQEHRRNVQIIYLDPANFKDIGDGHTIADQLNECFLPYGLEVTAASNDRIGGWQLMYRMLDSGEFVVADNCKKTADAIPSRMHDEKKPGDLLKVPGDELDDVADETRYALYSFIHGAKKPSEIRVREAMDKMAPEDVTNRMIAAQKEQAKIYAENHPAPFGGNVRQRLQQLQRRGR